MLTLTAKQKDQLKCKLSTFLVLQIKKTFNFKKWNYRTSITSLSQKRPLFSNQTANQRYLFPTSFTNSRYASEPIHSNCFSKFGPLSYRLERLMQANIQPLMKVNSLLSEKIIVVEQLPVQPPSFCFMFVKF